MWISSIYFILFFCCSVQKFPTPAPGRWTLRPPTCTTAATRRFTEWNTTSRRKQTGWFLSVTCPPTSCPVLWTYRRWGGDWWGKQSAFFPPPPDQVDRFKTFLMFKCVVWANFCRGSEECWMCWSHGGHRARGLIGSHSEGVPHCPGLQGAGWNELPLQHTAVFQVHAASFRLLLILFF